MFIDLHTHHIKSTAGFLIHNLDRTWMIPEKATYVSAGLHPWHLEAHELQDKLSRLEKLAVDTRVLMVGECGLDKVCDVDFGLQMSAFKGQIALANRLKKPLLLHCVRAYNEVMQSLMEVKNDVPAIFHGFNKNRETAEMILRKGYYLSFGADLFEERTAAVFQSIPVDHLFLESDNRELEMSDLYAHAAALRGISTAQLAEQIAINLHAILGPEFKPV